MPYAIAIDGPSGAGKSTLAKALAKKLNFIYVDTGALYRALGYRMMEQNISPEDEKTVIEALAHTQVTLAYVDGVQRVFADGKDVSDLIRTPAVAKAASRVSAIPEVRAFLLKTQRDLAEANSVLMDGRDIGTVVLPQAQVKIFLTASPEARARRRFDDLQKAGDTTPYETVLADINQRDYNDSHRATAPLRPAEDSVTVDTSDETLQDSLDRLETLIRQRLGL